MFNLRTKFTESGALLYSVTCLSVLALALWMGSSFNSTAASGGKSENAVPAAVFPANSGTLGEIPDNSPGTPRDVTFTVSGVPAGAPGNVEVSMTFGGPGLTVGHSWVGDVDVTLIAPDASSHVIFASTGATSSTAPGDSSDLIGPYNFKDSAAGTGWGETAFVGGGAAACPAGDSGTTKPGPRLPAGPSPPTVMTTAYSGVSDPNGTWTLRITDNAAGDTGAVSAAALTVDAGSVAPGGPANVDFDGNGSSDYAVVRDTTPGLSAPNPIFHAGSIREKMRLLNENPPESIGGGSPGTNATWYAHRADNTDMIAGFGEPSTDFFTPSDFDGDGKADLAVWRPGAPSSAAFYIFRRSDNSLQTDAFGQTGDDPAIVGDYDGDGKSDVAVYRCPAFGAGDGQCFFYYRGSNANPNGNITYIPWGFGETFDFFVNPGDFDGDGKYDFCIQRSDPTATGAGQFVLLRSDDGGVEYVNWGKNTDIIVPGDYDGDGKFDFMVSRTETIGTSGRSYYLLERDGGGTGASPIRFGIAGDTRAPGDYDGDGKTDTAVWRPNVDPDLNFFYVLRSSDGALVSFEYGIQVDLAIAGWSVH